MNQKTIMAIMVTIVVILSGTTLYLLFTRNTTPRDNPPAFVMQKPSNPPPVAKDSLSAFMTEKNQDDPASSVNPGQTASFSEKNTVTGTFHYYLSPDSLPAPFKKNASGRICFEPAQLETYNNGELFCFENTQQALSLFGLDVIDTTCKEYWGSAEIEVKNLAMTNMALVEKDSPCAQDNSCELSTATLIRVIKFYDSMPQCKR